MICPICKCKHNLKFYLCDNCYKKFPIKLNYLRLYMDDKVVIVISLFEFCKVNPQYYVNEYNYIFNHLRKNTNYFVVCDTSFKLNDRGYEILNMVSKTYNKDILYLVDYLKK